MKKVYRHTCDRCRSVTLEMNGTVVEDSFEAAMYPFRVFISPDKRELWCDDCIEEHGYFCSTCFRDCDSEAFYSLTYVKSLGGNCPLCGIPFVLYEPGPRRSYIKLRQQSTQKKSPLKQPISRKEKRGKSSKNKHGDCVEGPAPPQPVLITDIQLNFRIPNKPLQ